MQHVHESQLAVLLHMSTDAATALRKSAQVHKDLGSDFKLSMFASVDQPVHWFLDTLHRHSTRYTDRPYGGKLPKDIDRISSLFY